MHNARLTSDTPVARHLYITGRVQGVSDGMALQADTLGVCGWVRDRRDGSVEAVACGTARAMRAFIDWVQKGPPMARVHRVAVTPAEIADVLIGFEQREAD